MEEDKRKIIFNPKRFVNQISKFTVNELLLAYVLSGYKELKNTINYITESELFEVLKEMDKKGLLPEIKFDNETKKDELSNIDKYLSNTVKRATPQVVKAARKSVKSYVEYLIYIDKKAGLISLKTASEAKEMLPTFLAKIKNALNDGKQWIN